MKVCRFQQGDSAVRIGLVEDDAVIDLTAAGVTRLHDLWEAPDPEAAIRAAMQRGPVRRLALAEIRLCAPVEAQEIWAAGVTYQSSKRARMAESDFSATAYDRVYAADRPELFFKALAAKVVAPGEAVGIRRDARWSVPEPELALVLNSRGELVGCTVGNDMSSRDIEGDNCSICRRQRFMTAPAPWDLGSGSASMKPWCGHG
jgi:2-dehydro-3-deoxy-D-arabinonate dehydratase